MNHSTNCTAELDQTDEDFFAKSPTRPLRQRQAPTLRANAS
jgi:hypothetical protein